MASERSPQHGEIWIDGDRRETFTVMMVCMGLPSSGPVVTGYWNEDDHWPNPERHATFAYDDFIRRFAPPGWTCKRCGSHRWVRVSLTGPEGKKIAQCVPCGAFGDLPDQEENHVRSD